MWLSPFFKCSVLGALMAKSQTNQKQKSVTTLPGWFSLNHWTVSCLWCLKQWLNLSVVSKWVHSCSFTSLMVIYHFVMLQLDTQLLLINDLIWKLEELFVSQEFYLAFYTNIKFKSCPNLQPWMYQQLKKKNITHKWLQF